jgi:hypothetical protein
VRASQRLLEECTQCNSSWHNARQLVPRQPCKISTAFVQVEVGRRSGDKGLLLVAACTAVWRTGMQCDLTTLACQRNTMACTRWDLAAVVEVVWRCVESTRLTAQAARLAPQSRQQAVPAYYSPCRPAPPGSAVPLCSSRSNLLLLLLLLPSHTCCC